MTTRCVDPAPLTGRLDVSQMTSGKTNLALKFFFCQTEGVNAKVSQSGPKNHARHTGETRGGAG